MTTQHRSFYTALGAWTASGLGLILVQYRLVSAQHDDKLLGQSMLATASDPFHTARTRKRGVLRHVLCHSCDGAGTVDFPDDAGPPASSLELGLGGRRLCTECGGEGRIAVNGATS